MHKIRCQDINFISLREFDKIYIFGIIILSIDGALF